MKDDAEWVASLQKITNPKELLEELVGLDKAVRGLGDPYYRDLYEAVIDRAEALVAG